jgi:hypothetical protein
MNNLIIYFKYEEVYNKNIAQAVVTDSLLATKLTQGTEIITHTVDTHKKFSNDSSQINITRDLPCSIVLIGTIPYHLLIANLYYLAEKGFAVTIDGSEQKLV